MYVQCFNMNDSNVNLSSLATLAELPTNAKGMS